jgi:hypothetical protein
MQIMQYVVNTLANLLLVAIFTDIIFKRLHFPLHILLEYRNGTKARSDFSPWYHPTSPLKCRG